MATCVAGFQVEFVSILADFLSDSKVCQLVDLRLKLWEIGHLTVSGWGWVSTPFLARTPSFRRIC